MIKIKDFFENVECDGHYVLKERVNGLWVPLGGGTPHDVARRFPEKRIVGMYVAEGVTFFMVV